MSVNVISRFPAYEKKEWKIFTESQKHFWVADQINIDDVASDFTSTPAEHQTFLKLCIASAATDNFLFRRISVYFLENLNELELVSILGYQLVVEQNHHEFYSRLLQNLVRSETEKRELYENVDRLVSHARKTDWLNGIHDHYHWVAYACIKGIFGATMRFAAAWYKVNRINGHKGFSVICDFISRDLQYHFQCACQMYTCLPFKPPALNVKILVKRAVEIEKVFCRESNFCLISSIAVPDMMSFIDHCGELLCTALTGCVLPPNAPQVPPELMSGVLVMIPPPQP